MQLLCIICMYTTYIQLLFSAVVGKFRDSLVNILGVQSINQSHYYSTVHLSLLDILIHNVRYVIHTYITFRGPIKGNHRGTTARYPKCIPEKGTSIIIK